MPIVLVDAPGVVLSLVGPVTPQAVQIEITGLTAGQTVTVTGSAGEHTWTVRGAHATTVTGSVLRLTDVATPLNAPITYTVELGGVAYTAGPITVPYSAGRMVLQSLDGRTVIACRWLDNADPRDLRQRAAISAIPGRSVPVVRGDVISMQTRRLAVRTAPAATAALEQHFATVGGDLLLRSVPPLRDFSPVAFLRVTASTHELFGAEGDRRWDLSCVVIDDPEPDMVVPVSTGDDFDAAWAGLTWDDFDAEMSGLTGDEFDGIDWTQYA